ncbi:glycosyltransferase family 2 protein [Brumicola nitratireducens]|uniref:Putative biofilm PGA synthesis N-glycosyltransferase PgaC n=1 Tax=Glaciecola nitratireducens (strain JCM 12485 / KCTC 12276 / FR1064) TaxID=1085623 RepID=G4QJ32_GLANF|nr:glycosyltransferase [Glaciecola nitratireducens]AEP28900.1 putative biofilm PGA synthesis N-glycosyltransferase PgaC [Glaciecola nitratireducens FR1064]
MEGLLEFALGLTGTQLIAYFWPFFILDMLRYVVLESILIFAFLFRKRRDKPKRRLARHQLFFEKPLVSILVPGKNEGKHLLKLVQSLAQQTYKNIELIVVDDGSDDETPIICRRLQREGKIDVFIRNEVRGGKASAANTAFQHSKGRYIVHIDADSHLESDAIEKILLPFYLNENVGAVGGDVRVANSDDSFASRLQTIEYYKTISAGRTASSELNILRIISGAHGVFRRDVLERIEGWDVGPGLDGDLTLKVRKLGYDVVHQVDAVCYTNVPTTFRKLSKQRYRWDKSLIRFRLRKHLDVLKPDANFRGSNFFSVLENIIFNVFFDFKWFVYFIIMLITQPENLGYIFIINYCLYFLANCFQFVIVRMLVNDTFKQPDKFLPLFLPLMPFYTGVYLRIVRTYSYIMEFFHKTSYDDSWNPWKVSRIAKKDDL